MLKVINHMETPEYSRDLAAFVEMFRDIERQSKGAGKLLVGLVKSNPDTLDILESRYGCARVALDRLLKVGQGLLDERLVLATCDAAPIISKLPIIAQKRILDSREICVRDDRVAEGFKKKTFSELTVREANRAFSSIGVIPVDKQKVPVCKVVMVPRYRVEKEGVRVSARNTLLTWDTLRAILAKHDKESIAGIESEIKNRQLAAKR